MKRDPRSPSLRGRKGREGASACGTNISTCRTTAAAVWEQVSGESTRKWLRSMRSHPLTHGSHRAVGELLELFGQEGEREEREGGREGGRGVAFSICLPTAQISRWNSVPFHTFTRRNVARMRSVGAGWREECNDNARSPQGESLARSDPSSGSSTGRTGRARWPAGGGANIFSSNKHFFTVASVCRPSARRAYLSVCVVRSSLQLDFSLCTNGRGSR